MDFGGRAFAVALEQAGPDGDVLVVDDAPDELERIRRDCTAANVSFLIGTAEVLPLPDSSVDAVLGPVDEEELERVLRRP